MGKVTKKEMPMWAQTGHRKPVSRREFLAHGLIPFAARAFVPGALGLLASPLARAQSECPSGTSSMIPFITLNLSGGAGLSANFAPRLANGDPLPSYTKLGLGNNTGANALSFETEFGVPGFAKVGNTVFSSLLTAIRANCTAETLANTALVAMCVQSQDDTSNNKFDVSGMVFKAGLAGSLIPNLGTEATLTGVRMQPSTVTPPRPLEVNNFGDILNSIGYTRSLTGNNGLTAEQQGKLSRLVASLSNSQSEKLMQIQSTQGVKTLIECAGIKNTALLGGGASAVSPAGNAELLTRWGLNANSYVANANSQDVVFSSTVFNALTGQAGSVGLSIGGYDYHNGTRTTGDGKDAEAGRAIGRILDTARILGKKVFLFVNSDGSVVSREDATPGTGIWTSDRGDAGLALMFMYQPSGRVETTGMQVGNFTAGQVSDPSTPVGNSPEIAAQAVFANYLKFNNRMDLFSKVIPSAKLEGINLANAIKVG